MTDALQSYLDSVRSEQFRWGWHDCALFAAKSKGQKYVDAIVGLGICSARDYRKLQREGKTLRALTTEIIGVELTGGPLQRGDVVLVNGGRGDTLGIAVPPVALIAADVGFIPVPLEQVHAAWRVE